MKPNIWYYHMTAVGQEVIDNDLPSLHYGGETLEKVNPYTYLGLDLD